MDEGAELAAKVWRATHGAVPVTDDGLCDKCGEVVGVLPADTLNCDGDVSGRQGVVSDTDFRANEVGSSLLGGDSASLNTSSGSGGQVGEVLLGQFNQLLVRDTTSTDKDHAVSGVVGLDVLLEVHALEVLNVLTGTENGAAEGLLLECGGMEVVENDFLELLVNFFGFTEDHITFAVDGSGLEL